ncbi:MAG: hypothetical protein IT310_11340 [Anaerolineales bacterium]|nr:hypothetical protein [Anaerolineales bacterium]
MDSENNAPLGPNDNDNQPVSSAFNQSADSFGSNGNDDKPNWLTAKVYETDAEKKKDFWLGVGLFFVGNIVLTLCQWGLIFALAAVFGSDPGYSTLMTFLYYALNLLPWAVNIGAIIYFAFTRSQVALGMLAGFGIALAIVICLGVIFVAACFVLISSGNL